MKHWDFEHKFLTLPAIVVVSDYHEFDEVADNINLVTVRKTKVKEIGFDGREYVGVIYQGAKPDQLELDRLLRNANVELEED